MPLTNKQYDAIMRLYDRRQYQNYRRQHARREEVYERIPRIRTLEESISEKACSTLISSTALLTDRPVRIRIPRRC